jgi:type VI secretion system protein ImpK
MTRIFNEEPTIALSRSHVESIDDKTFSLHINLTDSVKLITELKIYASPLLNAATALLGILAAIPNLGEPQNIDLFRQHLLNAIKLFRQQGTLLDYHSSVIEKSTFCLCSAFDEAILYTEWGERACWENQSLLSRVFSQRNGGEAFFILLEKASEQPGKLVDFIELQYILLMLGFKGRYRNADKGSLYQIKSDIYAKIRYFRSEYRLPVLESSSQLTGKQPKKIFNLWKILLTMVAVIIVGYATTEYWYYNARQPVSQVVNRLTIATNNMNNPVENKSQENKKNLREYSSLVRTPVVNTGLLLNSPQWEVVVAEFVDYANAEGLISKLQQERYEVESRKTGHSIELFIRGGNNLTHVRNLKNDLDVRFQLNTTLRKVQE